MKEKMSKITKGIILSTALYSSMSFAYRLDKNIELSYVNYSFISDALLDIIRNDHNILFEYHNIDNQQNNYFYTSDNEKVTIYNDKNSTLENIKVVKKGNGSSLYNSGVVGNNSAILSVDDIVIRNGAIKTFGVGAKGFYLKGSNKKAIIENIIIETMQKNSNAIEVAQGGIINLYNVFSYTGDDCSGGLCVSANSKMNASKATIYTTGSYSPGIYVNGEIVLKNSLIETAYSHIAVLEGNSRFVSIGSSLRGYKGFKVFNSEKNMSSNIGIVDRYINVVSGWAVDVNNTSLFMTLLNTNVNTKEGKFVNLKSDNEIKNKSIINIKNSSISGSVKTDQNNELEIIINEKSFLSCDFDGEITLNFADRKNSSVNITADSSVKKIIMKDYSLKKLKESLYLNGFTLFYNSNENEWLEGKSYRFRDGGILQPLAII